MYAKKGKQALKTLERLQAGKIRRWVIAHGGIMGSSWNAATEEIPAIVRRFAMAIEVQQTRPWQSNHLKVCFLGPGSSIGSCNNLQIAGTHICHHSMLYLMAYLLPDRSREARPDGCSRWEATVLPKPYVDVLGYATWLGQCID